MKEGRKPGCPEKTPDDELQKMPHTKAPKFKPQPRLEHALQHWWQARKAHVLTITPRVARTTLSQQIFSKTPPMISVDMSKSALTASYGILSGVGEFAASFIIIDHTYLQRIVCWLLV